MFNEPTVIILGAGASLHYGFPLGEKLRENIIGSIKSVENGSFSTISSSAVRQDLVYDYGSNRYDSLVRYILTNENVPSSLKEWRHHINFKDRMDESHNYTIDSFLTENPSYREIGKLYITLEILRNTAAQGRFSKIGISFNKDVYQNSNTMGWYRALCHKILENSEGVDKLRKNPIDIITFNYDTSLEYYLRNHIGSSEMHSDIKYDDFISIIHVHGKIELCESENFLKHFEIFSENIMSSMNDIRVIGENNDNSHLEAARESISNAERIYIMGFGFDEANYRLLEIPDRIKGKRTFCNNYKNNKNIRNILQRWEVPHENISNSELVDSIHDGFFDLPLL